VKKTALILSHQQIAFIFMLSTYSYYIKKCIHMLEAEIIIKSVVELELSWVERDQLNSILNLSWDWVDFSQLKLNSKLNWVAWTRFLLLNIVYYVLKIVYFFSFFQFFFFAINFAINLIENLIERLVKNMIENIVRNMMKIWWEIW